MSSDKFKKSWPWLTTLLVIILFFYFLQRRQSPIVSSIGNISTALNTSNVDVLTYHYDNERTGANTSESILTPQNVNSKDFGKLFSIGVDGAVYAQPLYKSGMLFIATEHDSVYAFRAKDGTLLWKDSFINPAGGLTTVPSADVKTDAIYPELGITGTPVIDPKTNTLYVVSEDKNISGIISEYTQELHALDLGTGKEKFGAPEVIKASTLDRTGHATDFSALLQLQRSALLLANNTIYIAWASNGDNGDYHGWIMAYQANNVKNQFGVFNDTLNGKQGGIWMSAGGISADGESLYAASGNGTFDPGSGNYGDSVIKFVLGKQNQFNILDYFSPYNQAELDSHDLDLGTSEVIIAPKETISQKGPTLLTSDKAGTVYVLDGGDLGNFNPEKDDSLQDIPSGGEILNNIAYFNDTFYVGSEHIPLEAFTLKNGIFTKTSETSGTFVTGSTALGTNPVVSADGEANAIVWTLDNSPFDLRNPAILHAYDANNLGKKLYNSSQAGERDQAGSAVKFSAPIVANGFVYVPGDQVITVYGLLQKP